MNTIVSFVALCALFLGTLGQRFEPEHSITCGMLDGVQELPGGKDIVNLVQSTDPCVGEDEVAFELAFGVRVSRWKAVRLQRFDDSESIFPLIELNCRSCSHMVRFKWAQLVDYGLVTLWKNELLELGEHAHYAVSDSISCFQPGNKYTFNWDQDGFPTKQETEKTVEEKKQEIDDFF